MPYLVEYVTDRSIGRSVICSASFDDALEKAKEALKGLQCNSAALLHTLEANPVFGEGDVLARYTPAEGWSIREVWPP